MKAIKRESLSEQVLASIIAYIRDNNLTVGDKLPTEEEFSRRLGVSRTSVREGMKGLSVSGVVESVPGRGTFLRSPVSELLFLEKTAGGGSVEAAKKAISNVMEMRTALEVLAGELAVERGTDEEIAAVGKTVEELIRVVQEGKPWAEVGTGFHSLIAQMSRNVILQQTISSLFATTNLYKDELYKSGQDMEQYICQHRAIYEALKARDKARVKEGILAHMDYILQNLLQIINDSNAKEFM